jgi:hypothetical protein
MPRGARKELSDFEKQTEKIMGKIKMDGRCRNKPVLEQLATRYPNAMHGVIAHLRSRIADAMDGDVISADDFVLIRVEGQTLAMMEIIGNEIAEAEKIVDVNEMKAIPAVSTINALARILIQILNYRHKKEVGYNGDEYSSRENGIIAVNKFIGEFVDKKNK